MLTSYRWIQHSRLRCCKTEHYSNSLDTESIPEQRHDNDVGDVGLHVHTSEATLSRADIAYQEQGDEHKPTNCCRLFLKKTFPKTDVEDL